MAFGDAGAENAVLKVVEDVVEGGDGGGDDGEFHDGLFWGGG